MSSIRVTLWFLCLLLMAPGSAAGQALTGSLSGTVKDEQGGVLVGAAVGLSSPVLLGGDVRTTTNDRGQWRFAMLPPGDYTLTVEVAGRFASYRLERIAIGAGTMLERIVVLKPAGAESVTVIGASRLDSRTSGLETRVGSDFFTTIPSRRTSMFDAIRNAPGISPTSPSGATATTVSSFGSAVNENAFLIDGTNFTCPCQGVSRAEPGVDVIKEVQVQSTGASVEFGNIQGAVFNVVTKQGGARPQGDVSYYGQPSAWTAQPVRLPIPGGTSGYERAKYRDVTANLGGPVWRDHLWFFAGYQHLRDSDSQPGTDPAFPRKYEQDKVFGKLNWRLSPSLHLMQSFHYETWTNPNVPTATTPFVTTQQLSGKVPSMTFANLTQVLSSKTIWDLRIGRFALDQQIDPSSGDRTTPSRRQQTTNILSLNAPQMGTLALDRITGKAMLHRYESGWPGGSHQLKIGVEIERGSHEATQAFTGGVQYLDSASGAPLQAILREPWINGGQFTTTALFASDSIAIADRFTVSAGLRFDHARADSHDLGGVDALGRPVEGVTPGLGNLYRWNVLSPRLGFVASLDRQRRTMLRGSYGRFHQGVLTGELDVIHPGVTSVTTMAFDSATGGYTTLVSVVDPKRNLALDPDTRTPRTDEFSITIDRQVMSNLIVTAAYVNKRGRNFIGWVDTGGQYREETRTLADGTVLPVFALTNSPAERRFLLTNPDRLFLDYDGLVIAVERRMSRRWQASGSYTFSRAYGTQVTSNAQVAEPQFSTVARPSALTFGQDPNDLTNAEGRLANDRPHVFRATGVVQLPWTLTVAANLQHFSGRPWMATVSVALPQTNNQPTQRILLEPRGSRRLSPQTLLDFRVAKALAVGRSVRLDLRLDLLNLLDDRAEEALRSDVLGAATFGQGSIFMDPRRAMLSARLSFGR
jgi:hypothetical protein